MSTEFSVIELKIIQFIKKYYLNKLIKGLLFSVLVFFLLSFIILLIEYFSFLSVSQKSWLISFYLLVQLSVFIYYVILPLLGFFGFRIKVSKEHINGILVKHFPEIKDKFWNLLELKKESNQENYSKELIIASIEQRIEALKPFDFTEAIKLRDNFKLFYGVGIIVFISVLIGLISPSFISEPGARLIHFTQQYTKPSPYHYSILNNQTTVGKGENFELRVKVEASEDYDNVLLHFGGNTYLMRVDSLNYYSYQFKNINNTLEVYFEINKFISEVYEIEVLPKPMLSSFKVSITKPKYTNLKSDSYENITELIVPIGSVCEFAFSTYETDTLIIVDKSQNYIRLVKPFKLDKTIKGDTELSISLKNENFEITDFLKIQITTINDDFPTIGLTQMVDSTDFSRIYFKGQIGDDYGFSKLLFITKIDDKIDSTFIVQLQPNLLQQEFFYAFDFNVYKGKSNEIQYYFEVFDNDGFNGPKSAVSELYNFLFPDVKDIFDYQNEQFQNIDDILSNSMNVTRELKNDLKDLQEKMINSNLTDWERKEIMKNIYSKKKTLEEAIKNIQEKNDEMNNYMDSFTEQNKELIEKQKQIQDILEDVMSDELKNLLDEFNKMMNNFNENKMNDLSEQIDISLDDLSKQLDKNLELLKRMKIEKQLDLISSDLEKHIKEQQDLSDQIDKGEKPENLMDKQQKEKEAVKELKDQYKQVEDINKELDKPLNLYDFDKEFDDIEKEFNNSLEQQKKNNSKKSQQSMQNNKSKMENLAFMMKQMKDAAFAEQNSESLENLLQILDNTVVFSFNQEKLIVANSSGEFSGQLFIDQKKLFQDFQVIKDSLYALAKREPSINAAVNKEIVTIESAFRRVNDDLTENRLPNANVNQQIVLTSANNLALFLSEVIKQLQQQMASSMPGDQNCQKPGNNPNPSSMNSSMKSMQQSLQKQLEKMMEMMKLGQNGQGMPGEMGKALSQQEKMQNMLQQMMNQGNVGSDAYETLKQAEQLLNKVREDIVRNNISNQTINRQKEILTRLLEAENAENEREIDDKRKSNTAEEQRVSETAKYFDNNLSNDNFKEKIIKQKLVLKKYYQNKYQNYVNQLDSINGSGH